MERGDYVLFNTGHYGPEYGRIASFNDDCSVAFVCFTSGCTAAACDVKFLNVISDPSDDIISRGFGFHRFDETCPKYTPEACSYYCPDKVPTLEEEE